MPGTKHLIQCHCILPQYRNMETPIFHKFVAYSKEDENGDIIESISKCNNCGIIHKIVDFCKSEIVYGAEDIISIISIEDIRENIPNKIIDILDAHMCDLATWEQVSDIFENKEWGSIVNLSASRLGDSTQIKTLVIKDSEKFKIDSHVRQDSITRV